MTLQAERKIGCARKEKAKLQRLSARTTDHAFMWSGIGGVRELKGSKKYVRTDEDGG